MIRRRTLLKGAEDEGNFVDLGLPSGLKWAKGNIVSDGNGGYIIGEEMDDGAYVSFGNIEPHFCARGHSTFDDGYDWGTSYDEDPYKSTPGHSISGYIPNNDAVHDAALALLGAPWRLPTSNECKELINNTDSEWTTIGGIRGRKFMKKNDHSVYIFFPATGYGYGPNIKYRVSPSYYGYYWTSTLTGGGEDKAIGFRVTSSGANMTISNRYNGFAIRAVR